MDCTSLNQKRWAVESFFQIHHKITLPVLKLGFILNFIDFQLAVDIPLKSWIAAGERSAVQFTTAGPTASELRMTAGS